MCVWCAVVVLDCFGITWGAKCTGWCCDGHFFPVSVARVEIFFTIVARSLKGGNIANERMTLLRYFSTSMAVKMCLRTTGCIRLQIRPTYLVGVVSNINITKRRVIGQRLHVTPESQCRIWYKLPRASWTANLWSITVWRIFFCILVGQQLPINTLTGCSEKNSLETILNIKWPPVEWRYLQYFTG